MMTVHRAPVTMLPVTIEDLTEHLRLTPDDGRQLLEAQIMAEAAAAEIEHHAQIALLSQEITVTLDEWPRHEAVRLPIGPVLRGAPYTAQFGDFDLSILAPRYGRAPGFRLDAAEWCSGPLSISYTAGFGPSPSDVPADLRLAIMDQAAAYYDARGALEGAVQALSPHTARIAARYRGVRL